MARLTKKYGRSKVSNCSRFLWKRYYIEGYTTRNFIKRINLPNVKRKHVPVRVMEVALFDAHKQFVKEHPAVNVRRRNFELQRPKYMTLKKDGK